MRRAAAATVCTLVLTSASLAPAIAGTQDWDGQDRGEPMSLGEAIVIFAVIPLAISGLLAALVLVPDWFRKAKASTRGGFLDDPTLADREAIEPSARAQITN